MMARLGHIQAFQLLVQQEHRPHLPGWPLTQLYADEVMVREEEAEENHTWATAVRKLMRRGECWFWWPLD